MNTNADSPPERATPRAWEQIRDAYIRGEGSLRRLAQQHGLPLTTVEGRCRREDWVALREKRQKAGLETLVGVPSGNAEIGAVKDGDWWAEQDREHLQQSLEVTRRLRQAVDRRIPEATATELEKLGGALEAVVNAERELLELTPRTARNKAPSLRPHKSEFGIGAWCSPVVPVADDEPTEPTPTDPGQTAS